MVEEIEKQAKERAQNEEVGSNYDIRLSCSVG